MYELRTTRDIALGNGTRPMGAVLARIDCRDCQQLLAAAFDQVSGELDTLPAAIELAEGVLAREVLTCLRNPHLCEFTAAGDEPVPAAEFVPPIAPPPAPQPRSPRRKKR